MIVKLVLGSDAKLYKESLTVSKISSYIKQQFSLAKPFHLTHSFDGASRVRIDSDADLLGLKYMTKGNTMTILIELEKSQADLHSEMISQVVGQNMDMIYDQTAQKIDEQGRIKETKKYLKSLYDSIATANAQLLQEEMLGEEIDGYMNSLTRDTQTVFRNYEEGITFCRLVPKQSIRKSKKVRFSIEKVRQESIYDQIQTGPKPSSKIQIQAIVASKLKQIIPTLVDKIYLKLQQEMIQSKTSDCHNCKSKKDRDFDDFINKQIRLKCRKSYGAASRDDSSVAWSTYNPEE